jgi:hypothetical protein
MSSQDIINAVLSEFNVEADEFFGASRGYRLVAARMVAAERLSLAGLTPRQIAGLIKRERTCVLYYLRPEMRAQRARYYADRYEEARPLRETARPAGRAKSTPVWSDADTQTAARMLGEGASDADFRKALGRSRSSARSRVTLAGITVRKVDSAPAIDQAWSAKVRGVSPQALADADRRARAPRSLTAIAFGDPPPGYSALDRRNSSVLQSGEAWT